MYICMYVYIYIYIYGDHCAVEKVQHVLFQRNDVEIPNDGRNPK